MTDFGHDVWWLVVAKAIAIFVFLMLTVLVAILAERKLLGRMQLRPGPNRVGPKGSLQSLADGIKLALKESITPGGIDRFVYFVAPIISVIPAFTAFAFIPFGPVVSVFGHRTPLQLTDLPVAVLFILGLSAIGVYGIVLGGWASGSTYRCWVGCVRRHRSSLTRWPWGCRSRPCSSMPAACRPRRSSPHRIASGTSSCCCRRS